MLTRLIRRFTLLLLAVALSVPLSGVQVYRVRQAQAGSTVSSSERLAQAEGNPLTAYLDIVFPAALRFFLEIDAPAETIGAVSLTVRQDGGLDVTRPVDLQAHLVGSPGGILTLEYRWNLAEPPVPVPFEPVSFRWDVTFADGTTAFAADIVRYEPAGGGAWQTVGPAPVTLHWYSTRLAGRMLRDEVVETHRLLQEETRQPVDPAHFVIYEQGATFCREAQDPLTGAVTTVVISGHDVARFPCSRGLVELAFATAGMIFVQRTGPDYTGVQSQLIYELVRRSYARLWGALRVPAWFISGLADFYRQRPDLQSLATVRQAARLERLYDLEVLSQPLPGGARLYEQDLWRAQSYLLVLYLADRFGAQAPFDFARQLVGAGDFDAALVAYLNDDLRAFWNDWGRWVLSPAAEVSAAWRP